MEMCTIELCFAEKIRFSGITVQRIGEVLEISPVKLKKGEFYMRVIRAKDYNDASSKAANTISTQVILKPDSVLGLATGSTPVGAYQQLIKWYEKGDLDFSKVRTVNLDEYVGLSAAHEQSYICFMRKNFFDHINIDPRNTHLPNGTDLDAESPCAHYDSIIHHLGGIHHAAASGFHAGCR